MEPQTKNNLIVIRGPSGAGKTTAAKRLFDCASRKTVIIQQDYYRFIFRPSGGGSRKNGPAIHEMIEHNISVALSHGYDVIAEGVLTEYAYGGILRRIFNEHQGPKSLFLLKTDLQETIRRNKDRLSPSGFTADDMREWYDSSVIPIGLSNEFIVENFRTSDEVFEHIVESSGFSINET